MRTHVEHIKIKAKSNLCSSIVDDELVMMDINQGKYFGMNQIGLRIWQLIQKKSLF